LRRVFTCGPFPHLPPPRAALPFALSQFQIYPGEYIQTDIKLPSKVTRPHPTPPVFFFSNFVAIVQKEIQPCLAIDRL
jgi:hypothetical protein